MKKHPAMLDEWYKLINSIYMDRNFYRSPESVFTHLVEVIGGLSSSASHKVKVGSSGTIFLAKALGWWLALCGQVGISSVEAMIWKKFPYVCPYCKKIPHVQRYCKNNRNKSRSIDWHDLGKIGEKNNSKKPQTLRTWQKMFDDIYITDDANDKQNIFGRLAEELGELAEGIRLLPVSHAYFMNEAVDVFAWLMRYANFEEGEKNIGISHIGDLLEKALWAEYPGHCRHCESDVCKCAPILIDTHGRLSREMPLEAYRVPSELSLFTHDQKIEIFRLGDTILVVGKKQMKLNSDLLEDIVRTSKEVLKQVNELNENLPQDIQDSLYRISNLASQQQVTQDSVDNLTSLIENASPNAKNLLADILTNVGAGLWTDVLLTLLKGIA